MKTDESKSNSSQRAIFRGAEIGRGYQEGTRLAANRNRSPPPLEADWSKQLDVSELSKIKPSGLFRQCTYRLYWEWVLYKYTIILYLLNVFANNV